jgi:hypothetical protein
MADSAVSTLQFFGIAGVDDWFAVSACQELRWQVEIARYQQKVPLA